MSTTQFDKLTFDGPVMRARFDTFGPRDYELFLKMKALPETHVEYDPDTETYEITSPSRFARLVGAERPPNPLGYPTPSPFLFDDQQILTGRAFDAKRFAIWSGCGNGKTLCGLDWSRMVVEATGGKVLIVTLNEIVGQWVEEAKRFYGDSLRILRLESRAEMRAWMKDGRGGIAITNYEKWNPDSQGQTVNEARLLAAIVLDESSRLAGGGRKQKWALIKSCKGVEYKLSLTATPAPNNYIEFASQASFLEKMRSENEIIWTWFQRDQKTQKWSVRPHAREPFFRFMSSWSIYVSNPKRYGWRSNLPDVPEPQIIPIRIEPTEHQSELRRTLTTDPNERYPDLFAVSEPNAIQRLKLAQVARGFRYRNRVVGGKKSRTVERIESGKPAEVARIARRERDGGACVLIWTVFDEETEILMELLEGTNAKALTGKTNRKDRESIIERFRQGEVPILVSRAKMLGYGMNFQHVAAMIFSGFNDSFADMYQAMHRAVRYGQTESVRVYFPYIEELEGGMYDNVQRKAAEYAAGVAEMERCYLQAERDL